MTYMIALVSAITAVANWLRGRGYADRYSLSLFLAALGYYLAGWPGTALGVSFLVWRSIGWFAALDMGRVGHSIWRDASVMALVTSAGAVPLFVGAVFFVTGQDAVSAALWALSWACAVPVFYAASLYGLPYKVPMFDIKGLRWLDHLHVAEFLSGAYLGFVFGVLYLTA